MTKQIRVLYWAGVTTISLLAVCGTLVFLFGSFASNKLETASVTAAGEDNITGWAWMGSGMADTDAVTGGWISLNSSNCTKTPRPNPDPCAAPDGVDYGLQLSFNNATNPSGGKIQGFAWSGPYGEANKKVCLGGTYQGANCSTSADCGGVACGMANSLGWVCFGDACTGHLVSGDEPPGGNKTLAVTFDCDYVNSVDPEVDSYYDCPNTIDAKVKGGWAKIMSEPVGKGWISLSSANCEAPHTGCNSSGVDYGLTVNIADTKLGGYVWQSNKFNNSTATDAYGAGWICFGDDNGCVIESDIVYPYLRIEGGDVFSLKGIKTYFPAPRTIADPNQRYKNAQYLIHVGESAQISSTFSSNACASYANDDACRSGNVRLDINSTTAATGDPYNFKLGKFDFKGLAKVLADGKNRYGHTVVVKNAPGELDGIFTNPLGGQVYVVGNYANVFDTTTPTNTNVDWSFGSTGLTVKNGDLSTKNGSGTIIVLGNLLINNNIYYETIAAGLPREQLASVVWIVLGDVIMGPNVTKVAGNFIILGHRWPYTSLDPLGEDGMQNACTAPISKIGMLCSAASDCGTTGVCGHVKTCLTWRPETHELIDGCGIFKSGNDVNNPQSLVISGTVFARQFRLERTYSNPAIPNEPAETFIGDGRLQLNPPPGMTDFAKGLPTFTRN